MHTSPYAARPVDPEAVAVLRLARWPYSRIGQIFGVSAQAVFAAERRHLTAQATSRAAA